MGFGCNAAGVVATRMIDSPRERLIAIITNNFSLCNGRWPTQILIATIFIGALVPPALAGDCRRRWRWWAWRVLGVVADVPRVLGAVQDAAEGRGARRSAWSCRPTARRSILQTLYTSLIDRTLIVLWRAVVFAAPAGAVIWLLANIHIGGQSAGGASSSAAINPVGLFVGLNGVILLAYVVAIPANEIVIPTMLMLTVLVGGADRRGARRRRDVIQLGDAGRTACCVGVGGWTLLTGINLMLFSLMHNPCSTTIYTIYQETRSLKWTAVATVLPVVLGAATITMVTWIARALRLV